MDRRLFLKTSAAATLGWSLAERLHAALAYETPRTADPASGRELEALLRGLLVDWCDALVRLQVDDPAHPERHGAFRCPACGIFHGRCADAVHPLLHLAATTGNPRYRDAAVRVFDWSRNVDAPDGAWTNDLDPKSWKGTTVFAAIAVAEALHRYGKLLEPAVAARWRERLARAAAWIHREIDLHYGNINYGLTAAHALALLGRVLDEPRYSTRGRELAGGALAALSEPSGLIFGEGRPFNRRSTKGGVPIDLGYNVEESLPAMIHYALLEHDDAALETWTRAAGRHLEFMLPDGALDDSWGTRSYKWTYWGSRTSDGCAAAFLALAPRHPVFATAVLRNTRLLRACTHNGLLHGGPHLASHGIEPCVHHTFTHAKALAGALETGVDFARLDLSTPLPRETARGVTSFPEIDTHLAAFGPWRATVTGYDWLYSPATVQATGGALSLLWHAQLGPLFTASLARFSLVERLNMQPQPDGEDFALTPRVAFSEGDLAFSNLDALDAAISSQTSAESVQVHVRTRAVSPEQKDPASGPAPFELGYEFSHTTATLRARFAGSARRPWKLVLPVVSSRTEPVRQVSERRWEIEKPGGVLVLEANSPVRVRPSRRERIFNSVPGMEAMPFVAEAAGSEEIVCTLAARK